jgi:hypothetical protein
MFLSLLGVALWFRAVVSSRGALPTYGGQTVQECFFGKEGHPGLEVTIKAAQVAFDAMGTNCVPYLLDKVRTRETPFNRFYCWIYPRLPPQLHTGRISFDIGPKTKALLNAVAGCRLAPMKADRQFTSGQGVSANKYA